MILAIETVFGFNFEETNDLISKHLKYWFDLLKFFTYNCNKKNESKKFYFRWKKS
jgi:hypothetical protein